MLIEPGLLNYVGKGPKKKLIIWLIPIGGRWCNEMGISVGAPCLKEWTGPEEKTWRRDAKACKSLEL